jgi:hypothetical protein
MLCSITQKYEEIENVQKWNLMEVIKKSYQCKGKSDGTPEDQRRALWFTLYRLMLTRETFNLLYWFDEVSCNRASQRHKLHQHKVKLVDGPMLLEI